MKTEPIQSKDLNSARSNSGRYDSGFINSTRSIRNLKKLTGLSVGDVCVKKTISSSNIEKMDGTTPMRYVVIHKDEHGFLYTKRFLKGGGLSQTTDCITVSCKADYIYELDPHYANSIILGDEASFNPYADIKKVRSLKEKVKRTNRKFEIDFRDSVDKAIKFIDNLSIGQKLYNDAGVEFKITEINVIHREEKISDGYHRSSWGRSPKYKTQVVPGKSSRQVKMVSESTNHTMVDCDLQGLMTARPVKLGDLQ